MKDYKNNETMGRDDILNIMQYLGWITHDETGTITDEAYHVARELAGKVTYNVMLSCQIGEAVDKYRAVSRKHNGEGI